MPLSRQKRVIKLKKSDEFESSPTLRKIQERYQMPKSSDVVMPTSKKLKILPKLSEIDKIKVPSGKPGKVKRLIFFLNVYTTFLTESNKNRLSSNENDQLPVLPSNDDDQISVQTPPPSPELHDDSSIQRPYASDTITFR